MAGVALFSAVSATSLSESHSPRPGSRPSNSLMKMAETDACAIARMRCSKAMYDCQTSHTLWTEHECHVQRAQCMKRAGC